MESELRGISPNSSSLPNPIPVPYPSPCPRGGDSTRWTARGLPCPSRPSLESSRDQGKDAPGGLCATLRPEAALRGLQRRPQDFLPPGVLNLAGLWHALNPGPGASWWL